MSRLVVELLHDIFTTPAFVCIRILLCISFCFLDFAQLLMLLRLQFFFTRKPVLHGSLTLPRTARGTCFVSTPASFSSPRIFVYFEVVLIGRVLFQQCL